MNIARTAAWAAARGITLARIYITLVLGWAALYFCFGDRWGWLFLLNSVSICLFVPLPLALALGLARRRLDVLLGTAALLALAVALYGGTLLPRPRPASAQGPTLTVMSFNMLGFNQHPDAVVAALRSSHADIIGLQELSVGAAEAIRRDLSREYPYQLLGPDRTVFGMGLISRYPLTQRDVKLPGRWVGTPQIVQVDWQGTPITLANVHAIAPFANVAGGVTEVVRERERQAHTLAAFAAAQEQPLIVVGDFNTTPLSDAYRVLAAELRDSWAEAGSGLGNSFPGGDLSSGTRMQLAGIPAPMWLIRIDYVFHSAEWAAVDSQNGPWDGYADHRPVRATLVLAQR